MINYVELGEGLHVELKKSGYQVWHEDRQARFAPSDKAAEIQAVIDTFDPVPFERQKAKKRLIAECNEHGEALEAKYPEVEKRIFTKQETEARGYTADPTHPTPTLNAIAASRGVTLQEAVDRVIVKADEYTASVGSLAGLRQAKEDLIDSLTDWREIQAVTLLGP